MINAVPDTNVLASGFTDRRGPPGQLLRAWLGGVWGLVVSDHILNELERTFQKPYFVQRLTAERIEHNLSLLRSRARRTPITVEVRGVATHPEDDLVLAIAVSDEADYLITGDGLLPQLRSYEAVTITNPRTFLELLTAPHAG